MSRIIAYQGNITQMEVDAIVNAANKTLCGGGGVDGAIHNAAGPKLLEECKTLNGCNEGEAKITQGYNLKARYVIHTVGPRYSGADQDEVILRSCYRNAMDLAKINDVHSIAFPAISTGKYRYPKYDATVAAVDELLNWFSLNPSYDISVYLVYIGNVMGTIIDEVLITHHLG